MWVPIISSFVLYPKSPIKAILTCMILRSGEIILLANLEYSNMVRNLCWLSGSFNLIFSRVNAAFFFFKDLLDSISLSTVPGFHQRRYQQNWMIARSHKD